MQRTHRRSKYIWRVLLALVGIAVILWFAPVPYYISEPGSALDVGKMVQIEGGEKSQGAFYMTTVSMKEGNIFWYLYSGISPYMKRIPKGEVHREDESSEEYFQRQMEIMQASQDDSIIAAYRQAGKKVDVKNNGVIVLERMDQMPASKELVLGDIIQAVDGEKVLTSEELLKVLEGKKADEQVRLTIRRNGKEIEKNVKLGQLPRKPDEPPRAGLGIVPLTDRTVKATPAVRVDLEGVGGPSAGLMFALEIINQLTPGDLTNGKKIAGTGTMSPEGKVGQIGGVEHKVVAAAREGADYFFVPADVEPGDTNHQKAKETAQRIGTPMKIIPVHNLKEAVTYLQERSDGGA